MNLGILLLRCASFAVFFGRAWQHLFWDAPYRALFWDEGLLQGAVERWTPWTWQEYVTNPQVDAAIAKLIAVTGLFYLLCAAASLRVERGRALEKWILRLGSISLFGLSLLMYKEKFFQLAQLLEYALQVGAPLLLIKAVSLGPVSPREIERSGLGLALRIAIALTFICHGLYAIGFYPVPGDFVDMTMNLLGVQDHGALQFLQIVGALDLVVGVGVFIRPLSMASLSYCTIWGLATAAARVASNVSWASLATDLHQWLPEAIHRLPHGLVPAATLGLLQLVHYRVVELKDPRGQELEKNQDSEFSRSKMHSDSSGR